MFKERELKENESNDILKKLNFNSKDFKKSNEKTFLKVNFHEKDSEVYKNLYSLKGKTFIILDCEDFLKSKNEISLVPIQFFSKEIQLLIANEKEISMVSFDYQIFIYKGNTFQKIFFEYEQSCNIDINFTYPEYFEFEKCKNIKNYLNITECIRKYKNNEPLTLREISVIKMFENNKLENNETFLFKYRNYFKTLLDN